MKTRSAAKLFVTAIFSMWLINACAGQTTTPTGAQASPDAMTAIANASAAIDEAKANDWIWRDTEKFLDEARKAAESGDNATAIKLADKARQEAENAVIQYNYEKTHPRGL